MSTPLQLERLYEAPPEQLWQALTDPEQMKQWYFDVPEFRAEVGCRFSFEGGPPDKVYLHWCEVTEVIPNERLTYSWRYDGYAGNSFVTFELLARGPQTLLRLTHSGLDTFPADNPDLAATNFQTGWAGILSESLPQYLASEPQLIIRRALNAPRELVFKAWTQPEHLAHWWGPAGTKPEIIAFDLRPGGRFHYAMVAPDGNKMYGCFRYRHVSPPDCLIFTNGFADEHGNLIPAPFAADFPVEVYNVLTLAEADGQTVLTLRGCPINAGAAERKFYQSMLENMQNGFGATFEQLTAYLASLS